MKIIIADDDKIVTDAITTILKADGDIEVVGLAQNAEQAVRLYMETEPDIALFDIRMGELTGIDAAKEILKAHPDAKILFLTTFSDDEYIAQALKIGAKGYILKQDYEKIATSLKTVYSGQSVLGGLIMAKLPSLMQDCGLVDIAKYGLDNREQEIAALVADGYTNKEISRKVYLSEGTVRNYISAILNKLDLRDRTQLAVFYIKNIKK